MAIKASIIIRAYNAQDYIARAVKSALTQDFPKDKFEIVIVNDGSTDGTGEVLNGFKNFHNTIIINQENQGAIQAGNKGAEISRGKYIAFLDADDEFEPQFLNELCFVLDKNFSTDFVYPNYYEEFGGKKILVTPESVFQSVFGGILFRKISLIKEGFFKESVFFAEYDLFLRTLGKWNGYHYPKSLFTYHRRLQSMAGNEERVKAAIEQLKELHPLKLEYIKKIRSYKL